MKRECEGVGGRRAIENRGHGLGAGPEVLQRSKLRSVARRDPVTADLDRGLAAGNLDDQRLVALAHELDLIAAAKPHRLLRR